MKIIFYLIGLLAIWWEMVCIYDSKIVFNFRMNYKKKLATAPKEMSSTQNWFLMLQLGYMFWIFAGLMTSQWPLFLIIILMSLISKKYRILQIIDAVITASILIFIYVNTFNLHIDLWQQLKIFFDARF